MVHQASRCAAPAAGDVPSARLTRPDTNSPCANTHRGTPAWATSPRLDPPATTRPRHFAHSALLTALSFNPASMRRWPASRRRQRRVAPHRTLQIEPSRFSDSALADDVPRGTTDEASPLGVLRRLQPDAIKPRSQIVPPRSPVPMLGEPSRSSRREARARENITPKEGTVFRAVARGWPGSRPRGIERPRGRQRHSPPRRRRGGGEEH